MTLRDQLQGDHVHDAHIDPLASRVAQDAGHDRHRHVAHGAEGLGAARLELAGDDDALIGQQGFAGHARRGITAQELVEHRIGDAIGELVGVALGDGLRRK